LGGFSALALTVPPLFPTLLVLVVATTEPEQMQTEFGKEPFFSPMRNIARFFLKTRIISDLLAI
jgi:hypothetical protein